MGCQREIAEKIREPGADDVWAVKKNQKEIHQAIEDYFETAEGAGYRAVPLEQLEEVDSGHGRVEVRRYQLVPDLCTLPKPEQWKDLQGIARKANVTSVSASPPKCAITPPPSGRMSDA
jgi:hypothetical protein